MFVIFEIFLLESIVTYDIVRHTQRFLTRADQHIQKSNQKFYGKINHLGQMVSAANQEHNETYMFKDILFQPGISDFIMEIPK